jgi:spermidine synthase
MLAHLTDLLVTCAPIESLRLEARFDVALLASTLLNAGPGQRRAFLATCRHHLPDDGVAVFRYHPPAWFEASARRYRPGPAVSTKPGPTLAVTSTVWQAIPA